MNTYSNITTWTTETVGVWLEENGIGEYSKKFQDEEIDGQTLLGLNDNMVAELFPTMKLRVMFNQAKKKLEAQSEGEPATPEEVQSPGQLEGATSACAADLQDYCLPKFPPVLQQALLEKREKEFLPGRNLKGMLINMLFDSIVVKNVWFPSRRGYGNVCSTLLMKYNWLPGDISVWREALRRKFKKERQPLTNEGAVLQMRKKYGRPGVSGRKRASTEETDEQRLEKRQQLEVTDEINVEEVAEDEISIRKHMETLQKEAKKQNMDVQIINEKMEKTKSYRKKLVYSGHTISEVLEEFPVLRLRPYLIGETYMQHSFKVRGKMAKLLKALPNIESRARYRCKLYNVYKHQLEQIIEENIEEKVQQDARLQFTYKLLPSVFGESEYYVIVDSEEVYITSAPTITIIIWKCEGSR